jgi:hypothetical protein
MRAVNRKVGPRAAHGAIAPLLQGALGLRVRKAPRAQNRVAELTHSCVNTLDCGDAGRQLFLCLLFLKLGRDPLAQMVADNSPRVAVDMDSSQQEPEAASNS